MALVDRLPRGRRASIWATLAFVVVVLVVSALFLHPMIDLRVYRIGGRALLDGKPLYDARDVTGLPFTYTPFAAMLFVPAALLTFTASMLAASLIAALALVRSSWIVGRLARGPQVSGFVVAALVAAALVTEPIGATFSFGQVNLLIMWLVLEDLAGALPARYRGVLIGIAAGLKLTPGLFIVYFLTTRRYADAARATAVGALTVAIGFCVQPGQSWAYWTRIAYDNKRVGGVAYAGNQSIHGVVERLAGPDASVALWGSLSLVVAVAGLWAATRLHRRGEALLSITAVAFTMLLVSPISWNHHWVWVLLLLGVVAMPGQTRAVRGWLVAALVVFSSRCIWFAPYRDDREYDVSGFELLTQNAYALVALALLAWLIAVARRPIDSRHTKEIHPDGVPRASR